MEESSHARFGIVFHPLNDTAIALAAFLAKEITLQGYEAWSASAWEGKNLVQLAPGSSLIFTAGGDGTILRTAQAVLPGKVPILGINLGNLGFLTELTPVEVKERLPAILAGEGWDEAHAVLQVKLTNQGEESEFYALNDVVVSRGGIARIIQVSAVLNGVPFVTYSADGVIVATATGSTGYSLAARGPVLNPESRDMVLIPIAPHLSFDYPLVLPDSVELGLRVKTNHQAVMNIDGFINRALGDGAEVKARVAPERVVFRRLRARDYFYRTLALRLGFKNVSRDS